MQMWGGRFDKSTDALVRRFNASLPFDKRLYNEDISGSIAWARGLQHAGMLTSDEGERIVSGLEQVRAEFDNGTFEFHEWDEDIHTAVERRLTEIIGGLGGKLHTGRSRNDQVATDFRLWVMRACDRLSEHVVSLQRAPCRVIPTCNQRNPSPGATGCSRTSGHWRATDSGWRMHAHKAQRCRLDRARSPAAHSLSTELLSRMRSVSARFPRTV